ncbi:hypothetical protein, partial [Brucella grignonensis]|uniref:hypothetical protein n=1 Tax=Brucella grignonensis TaxID=94627 RepID=UPI001AC00379
MAVQTASVMTAQRLRRGADEHFSKGVSALLLISTHQEQRSRVKHPTLKRTCFQREGQSATEKYNQCVALLHRA